MAVKTNERAIRGNAMLCVTSNSRHVVVGPALSRVGPELELMLEAAPCTPALRL